MISHSKRIRAVILFSGTALFVAPVLAQSPRYVPPPPPTKNENFQLRLRYLFAPDVSFRGLGTVNLRPPRVTENDLIIGTERSISYDDGGLRQDYIRQTLVPGGPENGENLVSPNTLATGNFSYNSADQVTADGTGVIFHRYGSQVDPNAVLSGSSNGAFGFEVNYTKYINRKRNLGIQVGFSHTGFDSSFNENLLVNLKEISYVYKMENGNDVPALPPLEDDPDGGDPIQPPYNGERVRESVESDELILWGSESTEESLIPGAAPVSSQADLRSSIYNFRAGPTYNLSVTRTIGFEVGAGVTAIYYSGRFTSNDILSNPSGGQDIGPGLLISEDAEWQVGGYLDANAYYSITERVNFFSGAQFQTGSSYSQSHSETEQSVDVDFNTQFYVHAGLGIRF